MITKLFRHKLNPGTPEEKQIIDLVEQAIKSYSTVTLQHVKILAKARSVARKNGNSIYLGMVYGYTGQMVQAHEGISKAIYWYNKALQIKNLPISLQGYLLNKKSFALLASGKYEPAYKYAKESAAICGAAGLLEEETIALTVIGVYFDSIDQADKALTVFEEAADKARLTNDAELLGNTIKQIGDNYLRRAQYSKSINAFLEVCEILEQEPVTATLSQVYNNLGVAYYRTGLYDQALDAHLKSYKIKTEHSDDQGIAYSLNNIGIIYKELNQIEKAEKFYKDALAIYKKIEMPSGIAMVLNNLGLSYSHQKQFDKAIEYYNRSAEIRKKIGDFRTIIRLYHNLAEIYVETGQTDLAEQQFQKGLNLIKEDDESALEVNLGYGIFLLKSNRKSEAEPFLKLSESMSQKLDMPMPLMESKKYLADLFAGNQNFENAFYYQKEFTDLLEKDNAAKLKSQLAEMQTRFELERSENEKNILQEKNSELEQLNRKLKDAQDRLKELATHDHLTGLFNRRAMSQIFEKENFRFERSSRPYSIIMMDIDNFKLFNDTHGHTCGDNVLKMVSDQISVTIRKQDDVSRWGGEEFLVLCPDTKLDGIMIIAEKIRQNIENQELKLDSEKLKVTVTCGVACISDYDGFELCIQAADQALYNGKRQGKNTVCIPNKNLSQKGN